MTLSVALRACICFVVLTLVLAAFGLGSHVLAVQAGVLVAAALVAVLAVFTAAPTPQAIPVRVRRRRDPRA